MEQIILVAEVLIIVGFSAIFSGLNIALMSLSVVGLQRKSKLGNADARRVLPLRKNSHLSLSSILLGNVAAISASSLVLEEHLNGLLAGIVSTLLIVVFGEVIPQAWFVRFALRYCAFFAPFLHTVIFLTYPIAKPLQLLLDKLVGHEKHQLHSRDELGLIIGEHRTDDASELDDDEVEIIQGALMLSEKNVREIMSPIHEVYWLAIDATLDAKTVDEIKERGYSRIPIFDKALTRCYGVLLMKDMVDIDFDDSPQPISSFNLHKTQAIGSRTALDTMFRKFISIRSHLVPIERDDEIIGIVTIEDLVEEIIGHEISDESDYLRMRQ